MTDADIRAAVERARRIVRFAEKHPFAEGSDADDARALLTLAERVERIEALLVKVAALDDCEAHIEDAFERLLPEIRALSPAKEGKHDDSSGAVAPPFDHK